MQEPEAILTCLMLHLENLTMSYKTLNVNRINQFAFHAMVNAVA